MNGPSAPVPDDDPRMIAWKKYKATDDYANTLKWAIGPVDANPRTAERHRGWVEGALWAAFCAGFTQGGICVGLVAARLDAERVSGGAAARGES